MYNCCNSFRCGGNAWHPYTSWHHRLLQCALGFAVFSMHSSSSRALCCVSSTSTSVLFHSSYVVPRPVTEALSMSQQLRALLLAHSYALSMFAVQLPPFWFGVAAACPFMSSLHATKYHGCLLVGYDRISEAQQWMDTAFILHTRGLQDYTHLRSVLLSKVMACC